MPDARVEAAIANWAPRFVTQGVDFNDFRRTTARVETWEEWLPAWVETGDAHRALAEEAEGEGRSLSAGEAWVRAALAYHFAKFVWILDVERNHETTRKAREALAAGPPPARPLRRTGRGAVGGNGARRQPPRPARRAARAPHPRARLDEGGVLPLGGGVPAPRPRDVLARRAGAGREWLRDAHPRRLRGSGLGRARRARRPAPVGAAGVSLGGYYAPRAAAREPRIRAVAGISGPYDFGECWDGLPHLTREAFRHHSGAADDEDAREKAHELNLAGVVGDLEQPALLVTGRLDRIIPWEQTERIAREAPNATFVLYEDGAHVCNNLPYRYRPLVGDWLAERLAGVG